LDERIDYAVSLIKQGKGNTPIPFIAEQACLSKRQFERRFLAGIGISPKVFSRIVKFGNTRRLLKSGPIGVFLIWRSTAVIMTMLT